MTQFAVSQVSRQKTAALLTDVWQRNLPLVERRISILERAAASPTPAELSEDLRAEAASVAHKLAGSLGMFGFSRGTELARSLELILESPMPDVSRLASLTAQLRSVLFPEG